MTSGSFSGASGGADFWRWLDHPRFGPILTVALIAVVLNFVNVSSVLAEAGHSIAVWEPFVWEGSSLAIILAMTPAIGAAVRRWPPRREHLVRTALIHGALTAPFAIIHVAGAFVMRNAAYWAMSAHYDFFQHGVVARLIYEWRKDVLVYAGIALVYALFQARNIAPPQDDRIEVRDGATAVFLAPRDILWIEAAGNYVEIHTAARTHLVRGTLAAWERKLADRDFARAHRSRLVNRVRIAAIKPTASGDVDIALDTGAAIAGSRRYRDALRGPR